MKKGILTCSIVLIGVLAILSLPAQALYMSTEAICEWMPMYPGDTGYWRVFNETEDSEWIYSLAWGNDEGTEAYAEAEDDGTEAWVAATVRAFTWGSPWTNSRGESTWSETFTSGVDPVFNFHIPGGSLSAVSVMPQSYARATYEIDILLNGSSIWNSSATLDGDGNLFESGEDIIPGGSFLTLDGWWMCYVNEIFGSLDLSPYVNPGDVFELEYILRTIAEADGDYHGAVVDFADPFNLTTNAERGGTPGPGPGPIPEPGTMLLLGIGLAGLTIVGRRKFKK